MKVLYITYIPSPYRVNFFEKLGEKVSLTVLFECASEPCRDASWKLNEFKNFEGIFLDNGNHTHTTVNFGVRKYLKENARKFDYIVITNAISKNGYLETSYLRHHHIDFLIEGDGAFVCEGENPLKRAVKKLLHKGAAGYISTCGPHDDYYRYYGADPRKIFRVSFSSVFDDEIIDKPVSKEERDKLRSELGLSGSHIVVFVGQFIPRKGIDVLLEASKLLKEGTEIYLLGGDTKYPEYTNVHSVGFVLPAKVKEYFLAADVFALPTREDIWGLVVNEAMAAGLPTVSTKRCNAALEMVDTNDHRNGLIVDTDDAKAFANAINEILNADDATRGEMAQNAINKAHTQTIETMVTDRLAAMKKAYDEVLFVGSFVPNEIEEKSAFVSSAGNRFQNNYIKNVKATGRKVIEKSYVGIPIGTKLPSETYVQKENGFVSSLINFRKSVKNALSKADVVVSYNVVYAWLFLPAMARRLHKKSILILADYSPVESFSSFTRKTYAKVMLRTIRKYNTVVGLSKDVERVLKPKQKFILMEGGIDEEFFNSFDSPKPSGNKVTNFMYSGLLSVGTGVDLLLQAMKQIDDNDIRLIITGKGELSSTVREASKEDKRIIYAGSLAYADYIDKLKGADVLINPRNMTMTENENNFPSKVIDYLATGKPIISTRFAGWEKFTQYITFTDTTTKAIADAIRRAQFETNEQYEAKRAFAKTFLWKSEIERLF